MDETDTLDDIVAELDRKKASYLRTLRFFGGDANRRQIRRVGDIPSGSVHHHTTQLEDRGLISHIGEEHVGKGGTAKVFELTEIGGEVAEELADSDPTIEEMDEAVSEVEDFDRQLSQLQDSHEEKSAEMQEEIEELKAKYSEVKSSLDKVLAYIENEESEADGEGF